jgi:hypothetical protein
VQGSPKRHRKVEREDERSRATIIRTRAFGSGREAEHAILPIPFGGCIDQAGEPDATGQPALYCGLDQWRGKERERDRHVDMARAAVLADRDLGDVANGAGLDLREPKVEFSSRNRNSESRRLSLHSSPGRDRENNSQRLLKKQVFTQPGSESVQRACPRRRQLTSKAVNATPTARSLK